MLITNLICKKQCSSLSKKDEFQKRSNKNSKIQSFNRKVNTSKYFSIDIHKIYKSKPIKIRR